MTILLLRCGIVVGPLYLLVGVAQGLVRDGFSFARHPLSVLANGQYGWIQTTNFALTGLMVITAAVGVKRALGPKSKLLVGFLGAYGAAVFLASFFPADPVDGFPPGTPLGMPTSISTTGLMHFACGGLGFASLSISGFTGAWTFLRRKMLPLSLLSLASGFTVAIGFFGGLALPIGIAGIWIAVVVGWIWLSVVCWRVEPVRIDSC
jgi:Protein of unknown function (DUF998)